MKGYAKKGALRPSDKIHPGAERNSSLIVPVRVASGAPRTYHPGVTPWLSRRANSPALLEAFPAKHRATLRWTERNRGFFSAL